MRWFNFGLPIWSNFEIQMVSLRISEVEEEIFQAFLRSPVESLAHQKSQLRKYQVEGRRVVMTELTL